VRAPDSAKATVDEIVYSIMEALKPWPTKEQIKALLVKKTNVSTEIEKAVRDDIKCLQAVTQEFYTPDAKERTREGAQRIRADLARIEKTIARVTKASPEMNVRLPGRPLGLEWLREECDAAIKAKKDRKDQGKVACARTAMYLILRFSGKDPTSGSRTSPLRKIAALLYQAIGGETHADLERACEVVLEPMRPLIRGARAHAFTD
jgi:hypothetical protein